MFAVRDGANPRFQKSAAGLCEVAIRWVPAGRMTPKSVRVICASSLHYLASSYTFSVSCHSRLAAYDVNAAFARGRELQRSKLKVLLALFRPSFYENRASSSRQADLSSPRR